MIVDALEQPVGGSMMFRKGSPDSVVDLFSHAVAVRDGRWSLIIRNRAIAFKQFLLALKKSRMWKTVGEKLSLLLLPRRSFAAGKCLQKNK